jgi:hypothetical protein
MQIEHTRAVDAERHRAAVRPASSDRRPSVPTGVGAVLAVALIAFAFAAALASTASARAIDAPGLPSPNLTSSQQSAPAPSSSGGIGAATVVGLIAGGIVLVVGGVLVFDAVANRLAPGTTRLRR